MRCILGLLLQCSLAVHIVYRRPSAPGARIQLQPVADADEAAQAAADGWVGLPAIQLGSAGQAAEQCDCAEPVGQELIGQELVPCEDASQKGLAGRKRRDFQDHATEEMKEGENFRRATVRWLAEKNVWHKPPTTTTVCKKPALAAKCDKCQACSTSYCFTIVTNEEGKKLLKVEKTGECSEDAPNAKRARLEHAKKYAPRGTPGNAYILMGRDKISNPDLLPREHQLKHFRPRKQKKQKGLKYEASCIGGLKDFLQSPPDGVHIFRDHVLCSEDAVRIPFAATCALEDTLLKDAGLQSFLMDYTFKTNSKGLLVGGIGPAGIHDELSKPSMRFCPCIFMLSDAEDTDAHTLLTRLYFEHAQSKGVELRDAFCVCVCVCVRLGQGILGSSPGRFGMLAAHFLHSSWVSLGRLGPVPPGSVLESGSRVAAEWQQGSSGMAAG